MPLELLSLLEYTDTFNKSLSVLENLALKIFVVLKRMKNVGGISSHNYLMLWSYDILRLTTTVTKKVYIYQVCMKKIHKCLQYGPKYYHYCLGK